MPTRVFEITKPFAASVFITSRITVRETWKRSMSVRLRRHVAAGGVSTPQQLRAEDGRDLIVAGLRALQRQTAEARHRPCHALAGGTVLRLCVHGADGPRYHAPARRQLEVI